MEIKKNTENCDKEFEKEEQKQIDNQYKNTDCKYQQVCEQADTYVPRRFLAEELQKHIKESGLNKSQFAELCNISIYQLNKLLDGNMNTGVEVLFKIAVAVNVRMDSFFEIAEK